MMVKKLSAPAELPDEGDLRAVLAYNMRLFRVNKGWSQRELARQCGLDRTYVSAIERKRWNIALSNIRKSRWRWACRRISCCCRRRRVWKLCRHDSGRLKAEYG